MAVITDIKILIEKIFQEEGVKKEFLDASSVKSLIDNYYLTTEFSEFDYFKTHEKENILPPGSGKEGWEKTRRKNWTGKNVEDSLSKSEKEKISKLWETYYASPQGGSAQNAAMAQIQEIVSHKRFKNQIDRLVEISDTPELNGFFNKAEVSGDLRSYLLKYFFERIRLDIDLKRLLIFLSALFNDGPDDMTTSLRLNTTEFTNVATYVPYVTLDGLFKSYFNNSEDALNKFFKDIEVEKERKGMYNDIGYDAGAKARKKKNHVSIVTSLVKSGSYYDKDNFVNAYFFDKFQKTIRTLEYPLIGNDEATYFRKYFDNDFVNNLASSLAKQYGDDQEVKDTYRNFLKSIGYESTEIDRYLYLFVFPDLDFSECAPEPAPIPTEETVCVDESYDAVPAEWTTMTPDTIYFDEGSCSYSLSYTTEYTTTTEKMIGEIQKEYKKTITSEMLALLERSTDDDTVEVMSNKLVFKSYYINPKPLLKIKLLACISKKDIENIEEIVLSAPSVETNTYNINSLFSNLSSFADLMKIYEQEMIVDLLRGNSLIYENLNFSSEATYIEQLSANLNKLIRPIDSYENIVIGFTDDLITSVTLTRDGYKNKRITKNLKSFASSPPQTRKRTINFLQSLDSIFSTLESDPDFKYLDFVNQYFDPPVIKKKTQNKIFGPEGDKNKFATAGELGKRAADFLGTEIRDGFARFSCLTDADASGLNEKTDNPQAQIDRYLQFKKEKYDINVDDIFLAEAPQIFQEIMAKNGKEALKGLGTDFLNRLGVCGIGDLVSLGANMAFSALNPQEYADELVKCAISKLDPQTAQRFHQRLSTSQFFENAEAGTQFLQTYRNTVGDALMPWDSTLESTREVDLGAQINLLELPGTDMESDYNFRLGMYGESLVLSFDPQQLLELLNTIPGGEWIRFFIEISDSIIQSCKFVDQGASALADKKLAISKGSDDGRCFNKRVQWPAILDNEKRNTIFQGKKKFLRILGENAKSIIVEISIKLIGLAFKQLFSTISATFAGDVNYFKQGNVIPDFFQDGAYFYNIVRESSQNAYISDKEIDNMVLEIINQAQLGSDELSPDSVSAFLSNTSYVVGEKQKLDLLKGDSSISTKRDILEANKFNSVGKLLENDLSKIDDVFAAIGKDTDIREQEDKLSSAMTDSNVNSLFCLEEGGDPFGDALRQNKGIPPEEAAALSKEKQDREKEQLCNFMDMVSNPVAPIFGKAFKRILSKDGPIFGVMEKEKYNIFKEFLKIELSLMVNPVRNDLYDSKEGFLSLMLHGPKGYGYERRAIYGENSPGTALDSSLTSLTDDTKFQYVSKLEQEEPTYSFKFSGVDSGISLREGAKGLINVKIGNSIVADYTLKNELVKLSPLPAYIATTLPDYTYSSTASAMFRLLSESINITKEGFNKNDAISGILDNNFPWLVERYYGVTKRAMTQSAAFTFSDWESLYGAFTDKKIETLLDIDSIVDKDLLFYQKLENDPRLLERKKKLIYESPFDQVLSKEDYIRVSALVELLIKTYTLEAIMKSFFVFRAFSEKFFSRQDILAKYIVKQMKKDLGENYILFVDLGMQIYLTKIELGIREVTNQEAQPAFDKLVSELEAFRTAQREDNENFIRDNSKNIEILVSDFAEAIVKETINGFRNAFSSYNVELDQFALGPLLKAGAINVADDASSVKKGSPQNKYFTPYWDASSMSMVSYDGYDQTRIILEKYIRIDDKDSGAPLGPIVSGRSTEYKGVVNLDSWKSYLTKHAIDFKNYEISQLWNSWKFGVRLSYIMPTQIDKGDVSLEQRQMEKAYYLEAEGDPTINYTIIPLVNAEIDVKNQDISPEIVDQFDLSCLIYELTLEEKYKNLFTEAIDIETLISLITIYNVDSFVTLLGGSELSSSSDLNKWYKNPKSFTNMKDTIIDLLEDF